VIVQDGLFRVITLQSRVIMYKSGCAVNATLGYDLLKQRQREKKKGKVLKISEFTLTQSLYR
jgi:hypothetical protein